MTTAQQAREALERIIDDSETPPLEVDIRVIRAFIDSAEAAQKDAKRYRWLRVNPVQCANAADDQTYGLKRNRPEEFDADIDAAMKPAGEKT